jgi:hypothetical protein
MVPLHIYKVLKTLQHHSEGLILWKNKLKSASGHLEHLLIFAQDFNIFWPKLAAEGGFMQNPGW